MSATPDYGYARLAWLSIPAIVCRKLAAWSLPDAWFTYIRVIGFRICIVYMFSTYAD
jgi:hypothetical protein